MWFGLLGPLDVRGDGGVDITITAGMQRLLLAALLLQPNQVVSFDSLVDVLWGEHPPSSAAPTLLNYVSRLRRALGVSGPARIRTSPGGYLAVINASHELDVSALSTLEQDTEAAAQARDWNAVAKHSDEGLALWRGEPLMDLPASRLHSLHVPEFGLVRTRLRERGVDASLQLGQFAGAERVLTELINAHPLRERLYEQQLVAQYGCGRRTGAMETYRLVQRTLREELGVDPSNRLNELHRGVLTGESVGVLLDLLFCGDPPEPARIEVAAPDGQREAWSGRNDLPRDVVAFTGRHREIERVVASSGASVGTVPNVWVIDGMAGVGKTALAVHVAHLLTSSCTDAQLYLDLYGVTEGHDPVEPHQALYRLLTAVGVPDDRIPDHVDQRAALWRATVAGHRAVLVFDNVSDAAQVQALLPGAAACTVLVTSRRRLVDLGDATPMSLDVLPPADAATLFASTLGASSTVGDEAAVDAVVRACGYLPLAIRIVAARLRHRPAWTLTELLHRLHAHDPLAAIDDGQVTAATCSTRKRPGNGWPPRTTTCLLSFPTWRAGSNRKSPANSAPCS
jgi:DNA-binding SARP family transcriptional activator